MADQKKQIEFFSSMTADKRNQNLAYLVKNVADVGTAGMYPAKGFTAANTLVANGDVVDILGYINPLTTARPKIIVRDNTANLTKFYELGRGDTERNDSTALTVTATALGNDGVYVVLSDDKVYQVSYSTSNLVEEATFPSSPNVEIGGFDGVYYWWVGSKIWRQLGGETPELMMSETGFNNPLFVAFWRDDMFVFDDNASTNDYPPSTNVYVWDKKNTTFYKRRIVIADEVLLAGGVVNNLPLLVTHRYDVKNRKETQGFIVVYGYNGEDFVELNKIKCGGDDILPASGIVANAVCKTTSDYMIFSVQANNEGTADPEKDLYKNYIYKVYADGSIQTITAPEDDFDSPVTAVSSAKVVATFIGEDVYSIDSRTDGMGVVVMSNQDTSITQGDYTDFGATYITNFLTNPYNRHRLDALSFTFEPLVNAEELDIYYRTSEREAWTLLVNVTRQDVIDNTNLRIDQVGVTPTPMQRYQVTKMPNGDALPEFNEIQYKIVSHAGFSLIGMWHEYSYLTRVTKR